MALASRGGGDGVSQVRMRSMATKTAGPKIRTGIHAIRAGQWGASCSRGAGVPARCWQTKSVPM